MQLPRTGHPSHLTPADDGPCTDTGVQSDPVQVDYCNAVLHGAPTYTIRKLQRVQNNAARIVLQAPRRSHATPLLNTLHWLPFQQRIDYKVALLTFKVRSTSTPSYLHRLLQDREDVHNLRRRSATPALCRPFTIAKNNGKARIPLHSTSHLELPRTVLDSDTVTL